MGPERLIPLGGWQKHPFTHHLLLGGGGVRAGLLSLAHALSSLPLFLEKQPGLSLPFLPSPHGRPPGLEPCPRDG